MESVWREIAIETTAAGLEGLAAKLMFNGLTGLVIEDEADFQRFLQEHRAYWDYVDDQLLDRMKGVCRVKFYVTDDADGDAQLARWLMGLEDLPYSSTTLREEDWAHSWKRYYKPVAVGERFYIVPAWEREAPLPSGRIPLYLNPGLTFGTGTHPSTQLCLEGMEPLVVPGDRVLDLGCGSGILSIAALRLGAACALGIDLDPKAAGVAAENAALNNFGPDLFSARAGDVLSDRPLVAALGETPWQVVLANIVADVIIPLSAQIPALLTRNGAFLCAGIIEGRADEVADALSRNGLVVFERREKEGWVSLAARRAR